MKKFTETKTVIAVNEMCAEPEKAIEITITNDSINLADDETIEVSYFSDAKCKRIDTLFSDYPTDDELEELIKKSERCDYVMF